MRGWQRVGLGGMIGGIDDGGDAVIWVEETEDGRRGGTGPGTCSSVVGNATAMGNGGGEDDVVLAARGDAVPG